MKILRFTFILALSFLFLNKIAAAESILPRPGGVTSEMKAIFSKENVETLCGKDGIVDPAILMGELMSRYGINAFRIMKYSNTPRMPRVPENSSLERTVYEWLAAYRPNSQMSEAERQSLLGVQIASEHLNMFLIFLLNRDPATGLDGYDISGVRFVPKWEVQPSDAEIGEFAAESSRVQGERLRALFHIADGDALESPPRLVIVCSTTKPEPVIHAGEVGNGNVSAPSLPDRSANGSEGGKEVNKLIPSVRNKIDDLSVPHEDDGYKKLAAAAFALTRDSVKKSETIAIDVVIGAGVQLSEGSYLHGFVAYKQSTTETKPVDDEDDKKDVKLLRPGFLWAAEVGNDNWFRASAGATAYYAHDFAQQSEAVFARAFVNNISVSVPGVGRALCGREIPVLEYFKVDCRLGAFVQVSHVMKAGTSEDLATVDDDEYAGIGGEVGFFIGFRNIAFLRPIVLGATYRVMNVFSGKLPDPHRWELTIDYKIPNSDFSLGISYIKGYEFDSFEKEKKLKFSAGYKY